MEITTSRGRIEYRLIKSRRKTMCVEIDKDANVTVRAPLRVNEKEVMLFLESKAEWILSRCSEQKKAVQKEEEYRHTFNEGDVFFFLGEKYKLVIEKKAGKGKAFINEKEGIICVNFPGCNDEKKRPYQGENESLRDRMAVEQILGEWYLYNMKMLILKKVNYYSRLMGVRPGRVTIRDQKTRWGSCSSLGNLNFNWRLIMAPENVLDYVVVHEMCHLKYMNHGNLFWQEVKKYCPDYIILRKWLKENGRFLIW